MASVFAHLLDTLPLHFVRESVARATHGPFANASASDVASYLTKWPNSGSRHPPAVRGLSRSATPNPHGDRLWTWTSASPTRIENVECLVPDYGYASYRVLNRIDYGLKDGNNLRERVAIETSGGTVVNLPLTAQFVHSRWLAKGGYAPRQTSHALWPLEQTQDTGVVVAFAYELIVDGDALRPQPYALDRDSVSAQHLGQLSSGSHAPRWAANAMQGDFMPRSGDDAPTGEAGGDTATANATAGRVLVALCLSVHRERTDFDPGEVAGVAKLFPQIFIKASVPLRHMRGAVKLTRPSRTQRVTNATRGRRTDIPHCNCEDESTGEITPLIVTDANSSGNPGSGAHPFTSASPFWSHIFAYYDADPSRFLRQRIHIVRNRTRDLRRPQRLSGYGYRDIPGPVADLQHLTKYPRQGEFDNIHLAPKLRLTATHYRLEPRGTEPISRVTRLFGVGRHPIDSAAQWGLDTIKMAPFCSHDCLHTHWRWGHDLSGNAYWTYGWNNRGARSRPYVAKGYPMVHPWHNVWLTLPDEHTIIYDARVGVSGQQLPALAPQVINHHGSAYLVRIANSTLYHTMGARSVREERTVLLYNGEREISPMTSMAAFYWHMRWTGGYRAETSSFEARYERVSLSTAQLRRARRFTTERRR